ncbi:MAG: hypothetical protein AB7S83_02105 [Candidatus Methanomethylophilaceae archaeon]
MIQLFGNKRRNTEKKKVFVDLEGYSEPRDEQGICVKAVELRHFADMKALTDLAFQDNVFVIEMSLFADGEERRRDVVEAIRSLADDRGGLSLEISDRVIVLTPSGIGIDKCRITRRGI